MTERWEGEAQDQESERRHERRPPTTLADATDDEMCQVTYYYVQMLSCVVLFKIYIKRSYIREELLPWPDIYCPLSVFQLSVCAISTIMCNFHNNVQFPQ